MNCYSTVHHTMYLALTYYFIYSFHEFSAESVIAFNKTFRVIAKVLNTSLSNE